jgi:hypothetical protein
VVEINIHFDSILSFIVIYHVTHII